MSELDEISSDVYCAQASLTTSATALGSSLQVLTELLIQADPDNAVDVLIGSATTQAYKLKPGDVMNFPIKNPALIYGKTGSSTATVNLLGRKGR